MNGFGAVVVFHKHKGRELFKIAVQRDLAVIGIQHIGIQRLQDAGGCDIGVGASGSVKGAAHQGLDDAQLPRVEVVAAAVGGHGLRAGGNHQNLLHEIHALVCVAGVEELLHQRLHPAGFVQHHNLLQTGQKPHSADVGQGADFIADIHRVQIDGIVVVALDPVFGRLEAASVCLCEGSHIAEDRARLGLLAEGLIAQVNGNHPCRSKGHQLTAFGNAVSVGVHPDHELAKVGVVGVDDAVVVAVVLPQGLKAVLGVLAVGELGLVAEHLAAVVNFSVAVFVHHKPGVVPAGPAHLLREAVLIQVKVDAVLDRYRRKSVAEQIQDNGVTHGVTHGLGIAEKVIVNICTISDKFCISIVCVCSGINKEITKTLQNFPKVRTELISYTIWQENRNNPFPKCGIGSVFVTLNNTIHNLRHHIGTGFAQFEQLSMGQYFFNQCIEAKQYDACLLFAHLLIQGLAYDLFYNRQTPYNKGNIIPHLSLRAEILMSNIHERHDRNGCPIQSLLIHSHHHRGEPLGKTSYLILLSAPVQVHVCICISSVGASLDHPTNHVLQRMPAYKEIAPIRGFHEEGVCTGNDHDPQVMYIVICAADGEHLV